MSDTIRQMIETMRSSASEIIAAGVTNPDELLEKSFDEFQATVLGEIEALTKAAEPIEGRSDLAEPLFKGLGTVGRVAGLVSTIASQIKNIKDGVDYSGQTPKDGADVPSDEVQMFLDHCLSMGELAMRSAVNEHVDIADDDEDDADTSYMVLKSADGADYRVKTTLPGELAKFATDPQLIDMAAADHAGVILTGLGVSEENLTKLFDDGDALHKDAPGAAAATAADPTADAGDAGADAGDDTDPMAQLNLLGRLLAAAMIQLQSFMDAVGADPNADDGAGADAGADAGTDAGAADGAAAPADGADAGKDAGTDAGDEKKKPPFAKGAPDDGELAKANARFDDLSTKFGSLEKQLADLLKRPEAAKALLNVGGGVLAKGAPGADALTEEQIAAKIDALAGEDKALVLTKLARGVPVERALAKHL